MDTVRMKSEVYPHVVVPGIGNSDEDHWQTLWERSWGGNALRIEPSSWEEPVAADWVAAISRAVRLSPGPPVIVAHSIGCLAALAWLGESGLEARGAFLVAPPDPEAAGFPADASGFRFSTAVVRSPTVIVASDDDRWCTLDRAAAMASASGAALLRVGPLGHINVAAGVGAWDRGRELLAAFESDLGPRPHAFRDDGVVGGGV
jgi:predicted alpha/beta hydrolase family esterase